MNDIAQQFIEKWVVASTSKTAKGPENNRSLAILEKAFNFTLPQSYTDFMFTKGEVWTPNILDSVVEYEVDLHDIQNILSFREAKKHTIEWQKIMLPDELFAFATDCMGNMFCFLISECVSPRTKDLPVYFFDHDFETTEEISTSFNELLASYVALDKAKG